MKNLELVPNFETAENLDNVENFETVANLKNIQNLQKHIHYENFRLEIHFETFSIFKLLSIVVLNLIGPSAIGLKKRF